MKKPAHGGLTSLARFSVFERLLQLILQAHRATASGAEDTEVGEQRQLHGGSVHDLKSAGFDNATGTEGADFVHLHVEFVVASRLRGESDRLGSARGSAVPVVEIDDKGLIGRNYVFIVLLRGVVDPAGCFGRWNANYKIAGIRLAPRIKAGGVDVGVFPAD